MDQTGASEPPSAAQRDLAFRARRVVLLIAASQWLLFGAIVALTTTIPTVVPIAIAIVGTSYTVGLVLDSERRRRAELADPITGEVSPPGQRIPIAGDVWLQLGVTYAGAIALVVFLLAAHAFARNSCARAGISTPTAHEGTCVRYTGLFGGKTVYNVVDAGHDLHMPGYDVQLLGTSVMPTGVTNPAKDPVGYPGGRGMLVSIRIAVHNTGDRPLAFDAGGSDVDLLMDNLDRSSPEISFPDLPHANGEPGGAIADLGPIAPHATATGWVSFVATIWAGTVLHMRPTDLEFRRPGDERGYVGQIRLWKWANAEGRAALGIG